MTKNTAFLLLILVVGASATQFDLENVDFDDIDFLGLGKNTGLQTEIDLYGAKIATKEHDTYDHMMIQHAKKSIFETPHLYEAYLKRLTDFSEKDRDDVLITCKKGQKGDFFKFGALPVGTLGLKGPIEDIVLDHMEDDCFKEVAVHFEAKYTSVEVTLTPKGKVDYKCTDSYIIGSTMNWN